MVQNTEQNEARTDEQREQEQQERSRLADNYGSFDRVLREMYGGHNETV